MIALVPTDDFRLEIRAGKDTPAGDLLSGQCLTVGAEVLGDLGFEMDLLVEAHVVTSTFERLSSSRVTPSAFFHSIQPLARRPSNAMAEALGDEIR